MKINLSCVVIAPNKNKVYKSYIGYQERILSCRVLFHTVKPRFTLDTLLIRTPHFYGQFALSLGKQSPYILSKSNPLDTDTPLIRTLFMVPSVSVLTEFDCVLCTSHCTGTVIMQGPLSTWPHELSQFSGTFLFLDCTIRLTLKHIQLVTYPENQIVNLE